MFKKLFIGAAAAAAVSVPLSGVAWADKPADPGAGNNGVPDRSVANVESTLSSQGVPQPVIDAFIASVQSGNSGTVAPGTAFKTGAKVPGVNAPTGYGIALNEAYSALGVDPGAVNPFDPGQPFGPTIPGSVTRLLTNGCQQHSTGTCLDP